MADQQTDLQKFHKIFDHDRHKLHTGKIEYRVSDIEGEMHRARAIIAANKLQLEVSTDAGLAQYKAFDVKEIAA